MSLVKLIEAIQPETFFKSPQETLEQIILQSDNHTEMRLAQLACLSKMTAICAQDAIDGTIGGFTQHDVATLSYLFEEELTTLLHIIEIKKDAAHHLEISK